MFDYETLRLFTWAIVGILIIGFAIADGFDMGVAALLPIAGRSNVERRIMINSIAPHWDGNQVWLITAGGAIFAIWPAVYATAFSGFYLALVLVLAALWLRPIGMDYRNKIDDPRWRRACDIALTVSGLVPPLVFGIGFGNLFVGLPFELNELLMISYKGGFWSLFTPLPIVCGVVAMAMTLLQGATFLQLKTVGELNERARSIAVWTACTALIMFVVGGVIANGQDSYIIQSLIDTNGVSNPVGKEVSVVSHNMLHNFVRYPTLFIVPLGACALLLFSALLSMAKRGGWAFLCSSLAILTIILTAGIALFPMIIPSSLEPSHSLTLWDATSSYKTLSIISVVAVVVVPVILGYTTWCYYKMFGRIDKQFIEDNSTSLY
ncbi:cytochrome d ubiquinol oxidase subunit II [Vibrio mediterranei]|uniref:cytochrome d ubiquinol oxidase subunit II n=1 Tax=Vibrio mediterranei TaxID=689 RepID=UPI00228484D2|nr:cytochrome d ubiquinol oxidase subunit II [Vibrio mediterranei]MCY9854539.1 cytochrome d ubiquinol oxidase subunit II [Vibrio mediterranei]